MAEDDRYGELERRLNALDHRVQLFLAEEGGKEDVRSLQLETIQASIRMLELSLEDRVHVSRYVIVERLVFGLAALALTSVFGAIIGFAITGGPTGG